jgi:hypothetical protein
VKALQQIWPVPHWEALVQPTGPSTRGSGEPAATHLQTPLVQTALYRQSYGKAVGSQPAPAPPVLPLFPQHTRNAADKSAHAHVMFQLATLRVRVVPRTTER